MTRVKFCGITNKEDALNAASLGADAIGFIFTKQSPRYVSPETVEEIVIAIPPFIQTVGVFVNEDKTIIESIVSRCKLDLIQLHGEESPGFCLGFGLKKRVIKSFRIRDLDDLKPLSAYQGAISAALLDTKVPTKRGGTGQSFDWGLALKAKECEFPIILAGGVTISNIRKAIQLVNPYAIDISSGIEVYLGKKDYNKMKEIIQAVK